MEYLDKSKDFAEQSKIKKEMNNSIPFKFVTNPQVYHPKGIPKVKIPKVKVREPKFPRTDKYVKLKLK